MEEKLNSQSTSSPTFSFVTFFSDLNNQLKRSKLQKELNKKKIFIYSLPDNLLETDVKKIGKMGVKKEFDIYMNTFFKVLKSNIPGVNLNAFLENSKNAEFRVLSNANNKDSFADFKIVYTKSGKKAVISFYASSIKKNIWHELLHMASSRIVIDQEFIGFEQDCFGDLPHIIGCGLNEGYTEVLSGRYFKKHGADANSYRLLQNIAKIVEVIVGKDNMEKWYFESNLSALFKYFRQFEKDENILLLLQKMDIINNFYGKKSYLPLVEEVYKDVLCTLLEWYSKKNGIIEALDDNIAICLTKNIIIRGKVIYGLTLEEVNDFIKAFNQVVKNSENCLKDKKI